MINKNMKKRLSDYRFLMTRVEQKAKDLGLWKKDLTVYEANEIFKKCGYVIDIPHISSKKRKRRTGQLSWRYQVTLLREIKQNNV